ncbi:MAG TPA: c-type cytochrome [Burkholderiales bacterium]|nr:c-type cytochrome [Burkholderiales bacterium]
MDYPRKCAWLAFALAGLIGAVFADEPPPSGRVVYERHCRTCHGGTAPADSPVGPSLTGIFGARAGSQASGVHSRVMIDSGILWDRESLRRFLAEPQLEVPGTVMPVRVADPKELESLLDFLESLR